MEGNTMTHQKKERMNRNYRIDLRVTETEKNNLQTIAREKGVTVSEYIRRVSTSTLK